MKAGLFPDSLLCLNATTNSFEDKPLSLGTNTLKVQRYSSQQWIQ